MLPSCHQRTLSLVRRTELFGRRDVPSRWGTTVHFFLQGLYEHSAIIATRPKYSVVQFSLSIYKPLCQDHLSSSAYLVYYGTIVCNCAVHNQTLLFTLKFVSENTGLHTSTACSFLQWNIRNQGVRLQLFIDLRDFSVRISYNFTINYQIWHYSLLIDCQLIINVFCFFFKQNSRYIPVTEYL